MLIRIHRAIAAGAASWRFCRGLLIGFVAGSVLSAVAFTRERREPVHTVVEPATYAVAALG